MVVEPTRLRSEPITSHSGLPLGFSYKYFQTLAHLLTFRPGSIRVLKKKQSKQGIQRGGFRQPKHHESQGKLLNLFNQISILIQFDLLFYTIELDFHNTRSFLPFLVVCLVILFSVEEEAYEEAEEEAPKDETEI